MPKPARRQSQPTPARRPAAAVAWIKASGGFDALSEQNQAAARRSYEGWAKANPKLGRAHDLADYVSYVQTKHADDTAAESREPEKQLAGIAPAGDQAVSRRARVLAALLAEYYDQAWLPASVADRLTSVEIDKQNKRAVLHMQGGGRILDHGDRLELDGPMHPAAADELAAAAERHGWPSVKITGSAGFRDALTVALALRQPPIPADHQASPAAVKRLSEALAQRAAAAMAPIDTAALDRLARTDPAAAAAARLQADRERCRAALAGKPAGEIDPAALAAPRLAELAARRDVAAAEAREARQLAERHKAAHSLLSRILPGADSRRQRALDREADRLEKASDRLTSGHRGNEKAINKAALAAAKANAAALKDWQWSAPINSAQTRLAALDRAADEMAAGSPHVLAAASRGDLPGAIAAADAVHLARRAEAKAAAAEPRPDPRTLALRGLLSAEDRAAADPAALAEVRRATAAALAGDEATIAAASCGDIAGAKGAGNDWQKQQAQAAANRKKKLHREEELDTVVGYN